MTNEVRAQTTDIALGIEALARRDVRAADAAFARAADGDNVQLRPSALQWRADVAWRLRGNNVAAARYLDQALALSRWNGPILIEMARLDGARHRYRDAARRAGEAAVSSADAERRGQALRTLVQISVDAAFSGPATRVADSVDRPLLARARDTLAARVLRFPGRTSDARALIDAGVILRDTAAVRAGLRSYFALGAAGIGGALDSLMESAPIDRALIAGGLYESAALLRGASSNDVVAYAGFLRAVRRAVEEYYRASLAGTARPGDVTRLINRHGRTLWASLHAGKTAPEFYPAALYRELGRRFGTVISIERSRGIDELHLGHRIGSYTVDADSPTPVVVLDGTIAAGIDDWLLDGTGGRAGWVQNDTIYQRRTGFTETPFRALLALTDPQTMPGELFRLTRDSTGDIERARRDSLGYFPGVAGRLFRDGAMELLDSARDPAGFARAMYESLTQASIVLHESRHVRDARSPRARSDAELEFRAKLDEVTGAPHPRLALTAILSPNIGDSSSHGQANRRIMTGLARWIRRNGASIAGYEHATPALLQLPNLTDDQLRAAFASMKAP